MAKMKIQARNITMKSLRKRGEEKESYFWFSLINLLSKEEGKIGRYLLLTRTSQSFLTCVSKAFFWDHIKEDSIICVRFRLGCLSFSSFIRRTTDETTTTSVDVGGATEQGDHCREV